ncbi:DUF3140 domain-containing protein [Spirosoma sp. KUDC1026]|uniref:DUF3140 domain-containing protein n=1 Tax=Spirosoma sp. KUDC1026 TaxID=2745947 RepID=UPI00159B90DC|nr:DUF3140 domain-containing protein [Spirosoma sp. KUDC1026]QKZ14651.1 DUF3140 domain-containing protein [Spirosoma sp. KUDC1026]
MATTTLDDQEKKDVRQEFDELVNMTPSAIEKWLDTDESKAVGQKKGDNDESTGHKSGEKIITIKKKKVSELTDDDYAHMRKVISYIRRHSAQEPKDPKGSNWEYSLKNWGHDPSK